MRIRALNEASGKKVYLLYACNEHKDRKTATLIGIYSSWKNLVKKIKMDIKSKDMEIDSEDPRVWDDANYLQGALVWGFFEIQDLDSF